MGKELFWFIYVKSEGLKPKPVLSKTVGMTMAVIKPYEEGSKAIICAIHGYTSAAAAAYAALPELPDLWLFRMAKLPRVKLASGDDAPMPWWFQIKGNFDEGIAIG